MTLTDEDWWELLCTMSLIREFEELAVELFRGGELPGFLHPSVGQEAIAAAFTRDLEDRDQVLSTHRGHGHLLAKGVDVRGMVAELYGRTDGLCLGLGGSMHITEAAKGILGANGIVGAGIPISCGAGLAQQLDGDGGVVVCFFGDGAVNIGAFHEGLNLAALWGLPVVYVCENNQYAESTAFSSVLPTEDLRPRAASYGIPGWVVDGNDVEACLDVARAAIGRAREGGGPSLVQADTYRWYGHHTGDVAPYRSEEETRRWKERDPLRLVERRLAELGLAEADEIDRVHRTTRQRLRRVVDDVRSSPEPAAPAPSELVFAPAPGGDGRV